MRLAQQLYEGVDFGEGAVGLITYMRTDSVSLAAEAVAEIRATIEKLYGKEGLAEDAARLQDQVEECAGSARSRAPDLGRDHAAAGRRQDRGRPVQALCADLEARHRLPDGARGVRHRRRRHGRRRPGRPAERHVLRANGSTLVKPGLHRRLPGRSDDAPEDDDDHVLPPMKEGDAVKLIGLHGEQHFTEPPPRFSEASLVKALEEYGIGRPSTYASIISTLRDREYVDMDARRFIATDIGKIVTASSPSTSPSTWNTASPPTWKTNSTRSRAARSRGSRRSRNSGSRSSTRSRRSRPTSAARKSRCRATSASIPNRGRPVSVRMGRFGPFVQAGTKDDEEKPKFAGLRPGQKMDTITLDDALVLFQLPRKLGETAGWRADDGGHRPLRSVRQVRREVRVAEGADDPYAVTLERAHRSHRGEEGRGCEPHHQRLRRRRHPGAERPLWSVHHRQAAQCAHPEGSRSEDADAGGMPRAARRGAGASLRGRFGARCAKGAGTAGSPRPPRRARARKPATAPMRRSRGRRRMQGQSQGENEEEGEGQAKAKRPAATKAVADKPASDEVRGKKA